MKALAVLVLSVLFVSPSFGTTRYIAQTAGTFSGGSACNGQATITPATWNSTSESAGDVSYICGTITASTNATLLTFGWSGSSGNPITLIFDTGAVIQSPAFNANGAIYSDEKNYITVNLGTNGVIQNTLDGTSGASCIGGSCSVQQDTNGVGLVSCTGCSIIGTGTIGPMYVHGSSSDENQYGGCVYIQNNALSGTQNSVIQNFTCHDALNGVYVAYATSDSGLVISGTTIYNVNWGIAMNGQSTGNTITGVIVSGNTIHDLENWNDNAYNNHHNGIALFSGNTNTQVSGYVYNNYFYGDFGNGTAVFDVQNGSVETDTVYFFNNYANVTATTGTTGGDGCIFSDNGSGATVIHIYNNTCVGVNTMGGIAIAESGNTTYAENNIIQNWNTPFWLFDSAPLPTALNYNDWYQPSIGSNGIWDNNGVSYNTLSSWTAASGFDANSITGNPSLNSDGTLGANSAARSLGTNLTSLCSGTLTALCSDKNGNARPSTGAWDAGAFQTTTQTATPAAPTNLTLTLQ
jgi:hypothetical protein